MDVTTHLLESARLRLRPDVLPQTQASLLQTINTPFAPEARTQRDVLLDKQAVRQLTEEEQVALFESVDAVEMANAQRWQAIAVLYRDGRETMTAYQVYEQSVKALSVPEKLALARLIIDEVVPQSQPEASAQARPPRQFGAGRHLLSGVGIDVDELMATPIDDVFAEYMPEEH